ncbi:hypothetical protein BU24DRAFT_274131 [Aaosphaeria arxii CBS 175.79]|uniref:Uncharacterized protein n=1 Tax=Aaosphaeria arxii CBS 175.79 TaxID=1450172 RepID=A0A6A5XHK7_9PLEO|nr:uncharacterized protein BU24DRAFT_274131 [Aaosphaeria arxii CBS 175.79]KAF2012291.1 hypothetical protein BU24DRAFT_274131 [Aaosphaeria arxii CBS 175.79]
MQCCHFRLACCSLAKGEFKQRSIATDRCRQPIHYPNDGRARVLLVSKCSFSEYAVRPSLWIWPASCKSAPQIAAGGATNVCISLLFLYHYSLAAVWCLVEKFVTSLALFVLKKPVSSSKDYRSMSVDDEARNS